MMMLRGEPALSLLWTVIPRGTGWASPDSEPLSGRQRSKTSGRRIRACPVIGPGLSPGLAWVSLLLHQADLLNESERRQTLGRINVELNSCWRHRRTNDRR
jgi:hypothetical protein